MNSNDVTGFVWRDHQILVLNINLNCITQILFVALKSLENLN